MKKTIFIFMALLTSLMCNAQQSWDFTVTNANDVVALEAATTEWRYTEASDRYENLKPIDGALTAGGTILQTTQGLKFKSAEKKLRIDVNKRVQLAGKNIEITIPSLKKGQTVTISFASTGTTAMTLDHLVNLENTSGFKAADKNTTQTGTGTVAADGDVTFSSTIGSVNIFSISVSAAPTPDDPQPAGDDHSVAKNLSKNQAGLQLLSGDVKYYNTEDLADISIDGAKVLVNLKNETTDIFDGNVSEISFCKKSDEETPIPVSTIFTSFDQNGVPSNSFFTVTGSSNKGEAVIDGTTYTTCLKMDSSARVAFIIYKPMNMTLYFGSTETASIKINGNKIAGSGSTYSERIEAGSYELTKDKYVNLFGIKLEPAE
ncbi:MAG: hypothetical protein J5720_06060 [Bacteroidaceae bacterium]|nr:hypothetical protein [Bacteroidaceae bacterium]